ncbi:Type III secretion protein L [Paraburkholderia tropica]
MKRATVIRTKLAEAHAAHANAIKDRQTAASAVAKNPADDTLHERLGEAITAAAGWSTRIESLNAALAEAEALDHADLIAEHRDAWRAARDKAVDLVAARAPALERIAAAVAELHAAQVELAAKTEDALLAVFDASHGIEVPPSQQPDGMHAQISLAARSVNISIEQWFAIALYDANVLDAIDLSRFIDRWTNESQMAHGPRNTPAQVVHQSAKAVGAALDRLHELAGVTGDE